MKFNVQSTQLLQQLQAVYKVINSKNVLKVLDNFLFEVRGDELFITGSDKENVMTARVSISESDGDGIIALPARRLLDSLKEVPNLGLSFFINDETFEVEIRWLNGHTNFPGVDGRDFPQRMPLEGEDIKEIDIPVSVILAGIERTLFAVAVETLRPMMTGIFWDIHNDDITFVSSDTHKLVRFINSNVKPGIETSFIMPAKPANILKGIIGKEDQIVRLRLDSKSALFQFDNIELSCLFIKGVYPNYNRVIPQNNPFCLTADRASFLTALRRVSLSASMASNLVSLSINPDEVLIYARDLDNATYAEERLAASYEGNVMTIGFNSNYIIDELNNLYGDTVLLRLSEASRPGIFVPAEQKEGEDLLMLLMPLNTFEN